MIYTKVRLIREKSNEYKINYLQERVPVMDIVNDTQIKQVFLNLQRIEKAIKILRHITYLTKNN